MISIQMPWVRRRRHRRHRRHHSSNRVYSGESLSKLRRAMKLDVPETKSWLTGNTTTVTTSGTSIGLVVGLIRGTGPNDRIGNHIRCQRLAYRVLCQSNSAASDFFRVIVVRIKGDDGGVIPGFGDVLNPFTVSAPASCSAPYNLDHVPSDYTVVLDKIMSFQQGGDAKLISGRVNLHDSMVSFNANAGTASDIGDGNYAVLMCPYQNTMNLTYSFRLEYYDV